MVPEAGAVLVVGAFGDPAIMGRGIVSADALRISGAISFFCRRCARKHALIDPLDRHAPAALWKTKRHAIARHRALRRPADPAGNIAGVVNARAVRLTRLTAVSGRIASR